jgi:hypothetical protein
MALFTSLKHKGGGVISNSFEETATHRCKLTGRLFKTSESDDEFPGAAYWFNPASGKWQVSEYSNSDVVYGISFEVIHR